MTRARERLVVTAVAGGDGSDERPSRFLDELGLDPPAGPTAVGRPLTSAGLVAELRRSPPRPTTRRCARPPAGGWPVCGRRRRSPGGALGRPGLLVGAGRAVGRPAAGAAGASSCGSRRRRWSRSTPARCAGSWRAASASPAAPARPQVLGSLVHALCELASGPQALPAPGSRPRLDEVLPELDLGAPWAARRRRQEALAWLDKFLHWARGNPRELVATELAVRVPLRERRGAERPGGPAGADEQGRAVVVDLKTVHGGRQGPSWPGTRSSASTSSPCSSAPSPSTAWASRAAPAAAAEGDRRPPASSASRRWPRTTSPAGPGSWSTGSPPAWPAPRSRPRSTRTAAPARSAAAARSGPRAQGVLR